MKDAYPDVPIIGHFEWFYHPHGNDAEFLLQHAMAPDDALRIRTRNAGLLLELAQCDVGICPTRFQRDQFPGSFHDKLRILHEGIDTGFFAPPARRPTSVAGLRLGDMDEIVTYATRGMEPYRGFPQFMHALASLQKSRPHLHALVVGGDSVHYGEPCDEVASVCRTAWRLD